VAPRPPTTTTPQHRSKSSRSREGSRNADDDVDQTRNNADDRNDADRRNADDSSWKNADDSFDSSFDSFDKAEDAGDRRSVGRRRRRRHT